MCIGYTQPMILVLLILNILAFALYGFDKAAARRNGRRIPESQLLLLGLLFAWPGSLIGQQVFRHKTRKRSFQVKFWIVVVLNISAFAAFFYFGLDDELARWFYRDVIEPM